MNELIQREPIFHRPELGTTRADFEQMTESTFWEVGASGRRGAMRFCEVLKIRVLNHPFRAAIAAK
ncbi:hypothetical protein [Nostoc sp.]